MTKNVTLENITLEDLHALAISLAKRLSPGTAVCLWGDLGAGKTTFSRLLLQALDSYIEHVPSPTFTLVQTYETPQGHVWHCDFYRLKSPDEVLELGIEDALYDSILLIEWPQKMGSYLPHDRLDCIMSISRQKPQASPSSSAETTTEATTPEAPSSQPRTIKLICQGDCAVDLEDLLI